MLDRFPTELLLLTLQFAAPLDYSPSFYLDRRRLLHRCCLVSKTTCSVAQPMLPQVFQVERPEDVDVLAGKVDGKTRGSAVRLLVCRAPLSDTSTVWVKPDLDVQAAVRSCPNIVDIRLIDVGKFSLDWLLDATALRSFFAYGSKNVLQHPTSPSSVFPNLTEVSISLANISDGFLDTFPSIRATPRLRALALCSLTSLEGTEDPPVDALCPILIQQLDVFALEVEDGHSLDLLCLNPASTLLDCFNFNSPALPLPRPDEPLSIRLYCSLSAFDEPHRALLRGLSGLEDYLDHLRRQSSPAEPPLPRTLIIPQQLRAAADDSLYDISALLSDCRLLNIEIEWEEQGSWSDRSMVSPLFWRKRRKQQQQRKDVV